MTSFKLDLEKVVLNHEHKKTPNSKRIKNIHFVNTPNDDIKRYGDSMDKRSIENQTAHPTILHPLSIHAEMSARAAIVDPSRIQSPLSPSKKIKPKRLFQKPQKEIKSTDPPIVKSKKKKTVRDSSPKSVFHPMENSTQSKAVSYRHVIDQSQFPHNE